MKKTLIAMALSLMCSLSSAWAADEMVIDVTCRDARTDIADAGYGVTITSGGFAGIPIARIWEQSIAGVRTLGMFPVRLNNRGMQRVYAGNGFALTIDLESFAQTAVHPASVIAQNLRASLICTIVR